MHVPSIGAIDAFPLVLSSGLVDHANLSSRAFTVAGAASDLNRVPCYADVSRPPQPARIIPNGYINGQENFDEGR